MRFEIAYPIAAACVRRLEPCCEQIQIAGSLRRHCAEVGDIEIVARPRIAPDLFGDTTNGENLLTSALAEADGWGWTRIKGGPRYRRYDLGEISLDLFMVLPPAQWGVILTIRTGPAGFAHRLVTPRKYGGLLPSNLRVKDGAIWRGDMRLITPDEQSVFDILEIDYIEPGERA